MVNAFLLGRISSKGQIVKKLVLIIVLAGLGALPLACADRNFQSPVSPDTGAAPYNGVVATPTP